MDLQELKCLLKLLGKPDYRAAVKEIKPNDKTRLSDVYKICRRLLDRDLIGCSEEITKIQIAPPGKTLLKLEVPGLPSQELTILKACQKEAIAPNKINIKPAKRRDEFIDSLVERGLLKVAENKIKQVWLTETGKEFLAYEYNPKGITLAISLDLLNNYLCFLRKNLSSAEPSSAPSQKTETAASKPTDAEILEAIVNLDRELGTENYLPIFYLREKFQPPLSREELDRSLYRLQKQDKIELSSLQEAIHYTPEQIKAGIPQDSGGPLFFAIVN
jgi:hypothetical protein